MGICLNSYTYSKEYLNYEPTEKVGHNGLLIICFGRISTTIYVLKTIIILDENNNNKNDKAQISLVDRYFFKFGSLHKIITKKMIFFNS